MSRSRGTSRVSRPTLSRSGGSFGDTWIRSTSSDQGPLAVYGAQRSADGALTLMVINKSTSDLTSPLAMGNFTPAAPAHVYRYGGANLGAIQRLADQPVSSGGLTIVS